MSRALSDRNVLFGIVALQMNFVSQDALADAMDEWAQDKTRSLGDVLVRRKALAGDIQVSLDALVERHLDKHEGDMVRGLEELLGTRAATTVMAKSSDAAFELGQVKGAFRPRTLVEGPASPLKSNSTERYRILWPHVKGGLGQIYVAEDRELHRRVALKEIREEHAQNAASRQRFVVEAEITGNLEHPGIVPVYGLGTCPDGRPFYAMRFIKGEDLMTAARRFHAEASPDFRGLEFRWLLRRFIDVCNTIAYAHSRGVLHRDLKPTNIMLGPFGETLVMDWGVAKQMRSKDAETTSDSASDATSESSRPPHAGGTSVTLPGQAVGTPSYMSPEQAAGRADVIGPASDVYSLGATLYVLLTGERPFRGESEDVLEAVRLGQFPAPREIKPQVPRALEAICRQAMALVPGRRYRSALALAEEIERWLADEPVSAWHAPWSDRTKRWVRRHQSLVVAWATAVGVALLALGLAVPLLSLAWRNEAVARRKEEQQHALALQQATEAEVQRRRAVQNLGEANRQRSIAQVQEIIAKDEKARAEKALQFLVQAFRKPDPLSDGRSLKVVDLLQQTVKDLDTSLADQSLMKATLLNAIGQTYAGLGMPQESLAVFQRAFALRRAELGDDEPETLESMHGLAQAYQDAGRLDKAIPILETTLQKRTAKLGDGHADTIESMNDLAVAYWENGQAQRAIPLYETTLQRMRAKLGSEHPDTLTIMDNLAVAYGAAGRHDEAIRLHQSTLESFKARLGDDHVTTLISMNNLARAHDNAGHHGEAIQLYEAIVPRLKLKLSDDHPTTLSSMHGLARAYLGAGDLSKAIPLFETTLARRRNKLGLDHPDTLLSSFTLASAYCAAKQYDKAVPLARAFRQTAERLRDRLPATVRALIPQAASIQADAGERRPEDRRSSRARD